MGAREPRENHAGKAGWITRRPRAGMGDPIRCAPRTGVVAVDCSLARSPAKMAFFVVLGFIRFVGKSTVPPAAGLSRVAGYPPNGDDVAGCWLAIFENNGRSILHHGD